MDRIEKALQKLTNAERKKVKEVLQKLTTQNFTNLDIKKLRGRDDIYRVRKGGIRIIYRTNSNQVFILAIERRGKNTYRNL
jgi:mRNA-degrading endonuclease RelE of RelBE toxin-antitoxin system